MPLLLLKRYLEKLFWPSDGKIFPCDKASHSRISQLALIRPFMDLQILGGLSQNLPCEPFFLLSSASLWASLALSSPSLALSSASSFLPFLSCLCLFFSPSTSLWAFSSLFFCLSFFLYFPYKLSDVRFSYYGWSAI